MSVSLRGNVLFARVKNAVSFPERLIGLMMKRSLDSDQALIINHCQAVHTFFMRFPIDVIYLDCNNAVVAIETLAPWRLGKFVRRSVRVIECPAGLAGRYGIRQGDQFQINEGGD